MSTAFKPLTESTIISSYKLDLISLETMS